MRFKLGEREEERERERRLRISFQQACDISSGGGPKNVE